MCMTSFTSSLLTLLSFLKLKKVIRPRKELLRQGGTEVGTCLSSATLHVIVIDLEFVILIFCIETLPSCVQYQSSVVLNIFVKTFVTFRCFDKPHCLFFYSF